MNHAGELVCTAVEFASRDAWDQRVGGGPELSFATRRWQHARRRHDLWYVTWHSPTGVVLAENTSTGRLLAIGRVPDDPALVMRLIGDCPTVSLMIARLHEWPCAGPDWTDWLP